MRMKIEPNLLFQNGVAIYYGPILTVQQAEEYYSTLRQTIPWKSDEVIIFGKRFVTTRKVAWYGDAPYQYRYSGKSRTAQQWTKGLFTLKAVVEGYLCEKFNSCLLNLYEHGGEGMGWHSDDETMLGKDPTIASISLGAERKFCFRHKRTSQTVSTILENGSLLVMKGSTQAYWQHCLPKSKKITQPRINLTFRTIVPINKLK